MWRCSALLCSTAGSLTLPTQNEEPAQRRVTGQAGVPVHMLGEVVHPHAILKGISEL